MTTSDRWKNWKPKSQTPTGPTESGLPAVPPRPQKFGDSPGSEPTKPTKPPSGSSGGGFVGFVGSTSAKSQKIEAAPTERAAANAVLGQAGVRLITLPEGVYVGIWSDLDSPKVRAALRIFGSDTLPVRYLDGDNIPMKYKLRRVPGMPVPASVLAEMERNQTEPSKVRDQMLAEMGWHRKGVLWLAASPIDGMRRSNPRSVSRLFAIGNEGDCMKPVTPKTPRAM